MSIAISKHNLRGLAEIIFDFERFAESFLKIKTKDKRIIPLRLNSTQKAIWKVIKEQMDSNMPVRVAILKARQLGCSTMCQAYTFWSTITNPNTHSLTVAHDADATVRIFEMSKLFFENLPIKPMRKLSNRRELVFDVPTGKTGVGLRSRLEIATAGRTGAGRGVTYQFLHLSEVALWKKPDEVISALIPTVPSAPGTSIILESTAYGAGTWWHAFWKECKQGANPFTPVFIPWYTLPDYTLSGEAAKEWLTAAPLDEEEKELKRRYKLTDGQIAWRRMMIQQLGSVDLFRQEYPCNDIECWLVSGIPMFDTKRLMEALEHAEKPEIGWLDGNLNFHRDAHGYLRVWKKPEPGKTYTLGVDVASGAEGGNYSCIEVVEDGEYDQVAEWHGRIDPIAFAWEIEKVARWYNDAMVAIEINGMGIGTQLELQKTYYNIYRWRYLDKFTNKPGEKLGWLTNINTKPLLTSLMSYLISEGKCRMRGEDLINEAMHFIQVDPLDKSGQAAPGFDDDRIMAFMIACFCSRVDRAEGTSMVELTIPDREHAPPGLDPVSHDLGDWIKDYDEEADWRIA